MCMWVGQDEWRLGAGEGGILLGGVRGMCGWVEGMWVGGKGWVGKKVKPRKRGVCLMVIKTSTP